MSSVISAVSTPYGRGGVAMIRVSGQGAVELCSQMFKPCSGKTLTDMPSNKAVYGNILYNGEVIDDGIATLFRAPGSFTGEDTVEICCHGGIFITEKVLASTYLCGAVPADPGEFSKRAFVNGKMALSEAEAVIDLIDAENGEQLKLARSHTTGVLSRVVADIREGLISLIASIFVYADYPDEDLSDVTPEEAYQRVDNLLSSTEKLCRSYETGRIISQGIDTVICGCPNTGKSSLLNALAGYDRAIVTSVPGTTRDTVEEKINIGRLSLNLCDTAGIHHTEDEVEKLGIERSVARMENAQLVLAVFDGSADLTEGDHDILGRLVPENTVIVINKTDISSKLFSEDFKGFKRIVGLSAKNNTGIDALSDMIEEMFIHEEIDYSRDAILSNARQFACADMARRSLANAKAALNEGWSTDVCAMELELALGALSELDSRKVTEEIVDAVFSRFCVGK